MHKLLKGSRHLHYSQMASMDAFNENGITEGTVKQLTWKTQRR